MDSFELKINNQKIFDFYKNGNLNFEYMNLLFIDILEKMMTELDSSVNTNMASKLLEKYTLLDNKIDNLGFSVNKYQNDISSLLTVKLSEYRKDYMSDLKLILSSNNIEHILPLIKETNINLLDKTTLLLNEILPKNQDNITKDIQKAVDAFIRKRLYNPIGIQWVATAKALRNANLIKNYKKYGIYISESR